MSTTVKQITDFLDNAQLDYQLANDDSAIVLQFQPNDCGTSYRDPDGDANIMLVIEVHEEGDLLTVFAPQAWVITDESTKSAVFEAMLLCQSRFTMVRFDIDPRDGEIRPNIGVPLEDAPLSEKQFHRLVAAMLAAMESFHPILSHALSTGTVDPSLIMNE